MIQATENLVTPNTKSGLYNVENSTENSITNTEKGYTDIITHGDPMRSEVTTGIKDNLDKPRNLNLNKFFSSVSYSASTEKYVRYDSVDEQQIDVERTKHILDVISPYSRRDLTNSKNIHIRHKPEGITDEYLKSLYKSNKILEFIGKHAYSSNIFQKSSIFHSPGVDQEKINYSVINSNNINKSNHTHNDSRVWEYRNANLTSSNTSIPTSDSIKIKRSVLPYDQEKNHHHEHKSILDILAFIKQNNVANDNISKKVKLLLDKDEQNNFSNLFFENPSQIKHDFDLFKIIKQRKRYSRDTTGNDKRISRESQTSGAQVNSNTNTNRGNPSSDQPSASRSGANSADSSGSTDNQRYTRVVRTKYGELRGKVKTLDSRHADAVEVYLGIPYASPPIGE